MIEWFFLFVCHTSIVFTVLVLIITALLSRKRKAKEKKSRGEAYEEGLTL